MTSALLPPAASTVESIRVPANAMPSRLSVPPHAGVRWFFAPVPVQQYMGDSRPTVPAGAQ